MKIYQKFTDMIGNTPLFELVNYQRDLMLPARLLAKLEYFNPAGSVKDRVAKAMIEEAEKRGLLGPGSLIVEPTSGNTGIGLAALAASRGYRLILTMPESMSSERRRLLEAYGAELILTEGNLGMAGAVAKAEEIAAANPGCFRPGQFANPANPAAHRAATGPEIWRDSEGLVDILIAGVGTGGTITGAGEYLKQQKPSLQVVAVEPDASPVLSGEAAGSHRIQGIGAGFTPKVLNTAIYEEIIRVGDEAAFAACRLLTKKEGLLLGISSGAALWAATLLAQREENAGKTLVVIMPDSGERYLSLDVY